MTCYILGTGGTGPKGLNSSSLVPFITSMLCLTLATNTTATCESRTIYNLFLTDNTLALIVYKIWRIYNNVKHRSKSERSPLSKVVVVMIESGVFYTASIIILFGCYMASHNAQYGVSNSVVQIIVSLLPDSESLY